MILKNKYIFQTNTSQNFLFKQLNQETIRHSIRVAEIASVLAKYIDIEPELAYDCGIWHDAGKTKILNIISKQEKLSEDEWAEIKKHPIYGVSVIDELYEGKHKEIVKETALYHHCRVNSGGYPQEIAKPILSNLIQILAISDCFEAMTAKRVYKEKINPIIAKEMIIDGKCGEFSKNILEIFENAFEEILTITKIDIEKKTVL